MYYYSLNYYSFYSFEKSFSFNFSDVYYYKRVALLHKALSQLKILAILMIKYSGLATFYKYIGDSGLAHPNLHFPNMNDFINNGKLPASSGSTASFLNSKPSSGVKDARKRICLTTKEYISSAS